MSNNSIPMKILAEVNLKDDLIKYMSEIKADLSAEPQFWTENLEPGYRGSEMSVFVAVISASGAALGALIAGLFEVIRNHKSEKLIIEIEGQGRLEIRPNTSNEKIAEYIDKIKKAHNRHLIQ